MLEQHAIKGAQLHTSNNNKTDYTYTAYLPVHYKIDFN